MPRESDPAQQGNAPKAVLLTHSTEADREFVWGKTLKKIFFQENWIWLLTITSFLRIFDSEQMCIIIFFNYCAEF